MRVISRTKSGWRPHLRSSERVAAESLTLLETLQSTAPVGFGFVDLDFCCVRINETLAAMSRRRGPRRLAAPSPRSSRPYGARSNPSTTVCSTPAMRW